MDKSCADNLDCRQDSYRKYHLFDQIAILIQAVGCSVQSFAEKEPGHNTRQHPQKIRVLLRLRHNVSPQHAKYNIIDNNGNYRPVSYTHLDVYKRQVLPCDKSLLDSRYCFPDITPFFSTRSCSLNAHFLKESGANGGSYCLYPSFRSLLL